MNQQIINDIEKNKLIAILRGIPSEKIVIGGKKQIKAFMASLLSKLTATEVVLINDERAEFATAYGMIKVYEF